MKPPYIYLGGGGIITEPSNPPISLADLIDAKNPPQMYYVPDSRGFERRIRRHIRANRQTPGSTAPTPET